MKKYFKIFFVIFVLLILKSNIVLASEVTGSISGYAWSDNVGWINFGVLSGNAKINNSNLYGYAWSENFGWINLSPTTSGVLNSRGVLSGNAYGENLGWIDFSGVFVDSFGVFSGTATGDIVGTINFSCNNCNVLTDWRFCGDYVCDGLETCSNCSVDCGYCGGGKDTGFYNKEPILPLYVNINNSSLYTNNKNVSLFFRYDTDIKYFLISNYFDFRDSFKINAQEKIDWELLNGDGEKTVYVKFFTYFDKPSEIILAKIILDTTLPEIKILSIKKEYNINENIIISGTTKPNSEIKLFLNNKYGEVFSDKDGRWLINLGKLEVGNYKLDFFVKDRANNTGELLGIIFSVKELMSDNIEQKNDNFIFPILDKINQGLYYLLPFFPKKDNKVVEEMPEPIVMVPKTPQTIFSGVWDIFPKKPINNFVLSPLPKDVKFLSKKFPNLEQKLSDVGISKITDIKKIKNTKLNLPGLTETLGLSKIEIYPGKFVAQKGIPVTSLTIKEKEKIPSDIIFAKTSGGLIDYNILLSLNDKGQIEKTIRTVVKSSLQLVFKTEDDFVRRVRGYVIFKSRKTQEVASNVNLDSIVHSPIFSLPNFFASLSYSFNKIAVNGLGLSNLDKKDEDINLNNELEKRLVIQEFEYINTGKNIYVADIKAPVVEGTYEIITIVDYEDNGLLTLPSKETRMITLVDPEGYIYEKNGEKETRVVGAVVTLYWQNPETKQYQVWSGSDYYQENPQITNVSGSYSFLVPEGYYYLNVTAPGYLDYNGKPFSVREGRGVHINIEMKTKYWWINIVDWKTALLILVVLMLLYNFYKDKKRENFIKIKN